MTTATTTQAGPTIVIPEGRTDVLDHALDLVTAGTGQETRPARIPTPMRFDEAGTDFLAAPDLEEIGELLIARHERLQFLDTWSIGYVWRREGTERNGKVVLGTMSRPSGALRFYSRHDFLVTLAADHCRNARFTERQLEALVFHELLHATVNAKGDGPALVGHDVEMFRAEIEEYGLWNLDLTLAAESFEQIRFDLDGAS